MPEQPENKTQSAQHVHGIRSANDDDIERIWELWTAIFPDWPIERQRWEFMMRLHRLPENHFIHDKGFCLSFLEGPVGKVAVVGVLPEFRGQGLGTALLEKAREGLKALALANDIELASIEIGSNTPRFWPGLPANLAPEFKDFFLHRGFRKDEKRASGVRDLYKDLREGIAPPEILERAAKSNLKFVEWSPELYDECIAKQKANFTWGAVYEALGAYGQHNEVLVAIDPETNAQVGWTLMSQNSAMNDTLGFLPLYPTKEKTALICAVGVDKSARGSGHGFALMVNAFQHLQKRGVEGIMIDWVGLQSFYERLGAVTQWDYECWVWE